MKIGFTGTRLGMSARQLSELTKLLEALDVDEIHLGDCLGADAEAYMVARDLGITTIGHPPIKEQHRANLQYDRTQNPLPFLERNGEIVEASEFLIAAPAMPRSPRGGTWFTVRYAERAGVPVQILNREIDSGY